VSGAAPAFAARLRAWLSARLGDPELSVHALRRHTEGFSWETYTLEAGWTDGRDGERRTRGLAVRMEPRDGLLSPYDIEAQYRLHRVLREHSDVPVPAVLWLEPDPGPLGMPFYVMERVEGHVPVQWRPADPVTFPTPQARIALGLDFVDVQARIHAIDWRAHGLDYLAADDDPDRSARAQLDRWVEYYEQSRLVELPVLREAIGWLRGNLGCSERLVLCHGDYRIGNVMVRDGAIVAVFDWELAHIGDPVEDIAYSGLPLYRGRDPRLSHLLMPEEYFARYEERTGLAVDPGVFHAWTVLGLVKAAACHLRGARAFEDGRTGDLRLAAMGHQVQHILRHLARALDLPAPA
jgi:aminoglycoside phosphotransferase (APT) family kinase protein